MTPVPAKQGTWAVVAATVVIAIVTEIYLFFLLLGCGIGENNPHACDGLRGGGETLGEFILVALPLAVVIALIGGWKQYRILPFVSLAASLVAVAWVLSVGSNPLI